MTTDGPSHPIRRASSFSCKLGDATDTTAPVLITALILIPLHTTSSVIRREESISSTAASPESSSSADTMPTVFRSSSSESRRIAYQAFSSSLCRSFLHLISPSSRRSLRLPPFPSSFGAALFWSWPFSALQKRASHPKSEMQTTHYFEVALSFPVHPPAWKILTRILTRRSQLSIPAPGLSIRSQLPPLEEVTPSLVPTRSQPIRVE
ncbi:hypothetical protein OUZ56_011643 [Daphnia magna]|uniref:Uncharacterized protein n=1 Tax=Daphnia magna TaxID=35525 RepID=A0ABQ9Z0X9_9CRUS|nr:hypothetical protein OUZ56_011643 [Daphnia magna]